jgi:hypothetical protein
VSHTPGPWRVSGKQSVRGPNGEYVARANWMDGPANAILIAEAPALLDELRSVLDWARIERAPLRAQEIASIEAAIRKATEAA